MVTVQYFRNYILREIRSAESLLITYKRKAFIMDIHVLIAQMIQLFLIIFCGYGLFKLGILTPEVDSHLTKLVVNVTMPLIILNSVLTRTEADDSSRVFTVFIASLVIYLLLPLIFQSRSF